MAPLNSGVLLIPTPDNEGLLLICKDGIWYPMHNTSDCQIADLLCNAKGYSGVECKSV